jgi:hypothetical protein
MQINTYAELVNFVATNALFKRVSADNDDMLYNFAIDFVLADAALFAIASAEAGDTDECVVFEVLKDDVYGHAAFAV